MHPLMRAPITLSIDSFPKTLHKAFTLIKLSISRTLDTSIALKMKKVIKWLPQYRDEYTKSFPIGFHSNLLPPRQIAMQSFSKLARSNGRMTLVNLKYVTKNIWSRAFYRPNFMMFTTCQNRAQNAEPIKCHSFNALHFKYFDTLYFFIKIINMFWNTNDYLFDYFIVKINVQ